MAFIGSANQDVIEKALCAVVKRVNDALLCLGSKQTVDSSLDLHGITDLSDQIMIKYFRKKTYRSIPAAIHLFYESAVHDASLDRLEDCRSIVGNGRLRIPVLLPPLYLSSKQKYFKHDSPSLPVRVYYNPNRFGTSHEIFKDHQSLTSVLSLTCLKGSGTLQLMSMSHLDASLVLSHVFNPAKNSSMRSAVSDYVLDVMQSDLTCIKDCLRGCRVSAITGKDHGKIDPFVKHLQLPPYCDYEWKELQYKEGDTLLIPTHCTFISFVLPPDISLFSQVLLESSHAESQSLSKWNDGTFDCEPDLNSLDQFGKPSMLSPLLKECIVGNGPSCIPKQLEFRYGSVIQKSTKRKSGHANTSLVQALRQSHLVEAIHRFERMGGESHIKRIKIDDTKCLLSINFSIVEEYKNE